MRLDPPDWGPDTPEETFLKAKLAEIALAYKREAEPLIDRLTQIQMMKVPRYTVWPGDISK